MDQHNNHGGRTVGYIKPYIPGCMTLSDSWRDKRPVAPIEEYEAYRDTIDARARAGVDPAKYRRITIMVRNGTPVTEAARLVGYAACPKGYRKLPDHLK